MLPISLTVKNFLSYREAAPTLRLEDIHVACLCGSNGNGKSALLDAITWVLWGRARGTRQEQLLHHGQDEMSVNLEFDVGGGRYRVERRYSRARRSAQSSLELSFLSNDSTYHPITADTIGATESAIKRLINMDYDTFVNSAFLIQGRADLFTMSTPAQRKEVLSKVLGLGLYDRLEERSKYYAKEAENRLSLNNSSADRLKNEIERSDEVEDSLAIVSTKLSDASDRIVSHSSDRDRLKVDAERAALAGDQAQEIKENINRVSQRRDADIGETEELEKRVSDWSVLVTRSSEIESGYEQLALLRERHKGQTFTAQTVASLQQRLIPLDHEIIQAKATLSSEIQTLQRRIDDELIPRADALPFIEHQIAELELRREALRKESIKTDVMRQEHQQLMVDAARLKEENNRLVGQGQETKSKLELLSASHDPSDCPLCGTVLNDTKLARIQSTFENEILEQRHRYLEQQAEEKQIRETVLQMADDLEKSTVENQRQVSEMEALAAYLSLQREDASLAGSQLAECRSRFELASSVKETGQFAVKAQEQASEIRAQLTGLDYDATEIQKLEEQIQDLDSWDQEMRALRLATERLPEIKASLDRTRRRIADSEEEIERFTKRTTELAAEIASLDGSRERLKVSEEALADLVREQAELQKLVGSLSNQRAQIETARREFDEIERTQATNLDEATTYAELVLAFGKGGIQALLIEAAIPRLEDEANELLLLMTDGRMSLKLETQRERKGSRLTGESVIETLDIVIADEFGTRPYEMFSGGERFRIDFALRIALSKLLAWRAGASLPTLFIDEGFGTQDSVGRDRLIEVIQAIEEKFERILVITHMEDIKDAFPVRIEVSRNELGSTFAIT